MATRECVLVTPYDCNMIIALDMVDKKCSAVELPNLEGVSEVFTKDGFTDEIYVRVDGYGGRSMSYLGDGQIGPVEEDYSVPAVGVSPDSETAPYEQTYSWKVGTPVRVGPDLFFWPLVDDDFDAGYDVKDNLGNLLLTVTPGTPWPDVATSTNRTTINGTENIEIVTYPYHAFYFYTQGLEIVQSLGRHNGQWFSVGIAQWGGTYEIYFVPLTYDSGSNTFIPDGAPTKVYETTDWSHLVATNNMYYTDDGRVIYKTTYDYPAELDLTTKILTVTPGVSRSAHYGMNYFENDIRGFSMVETTSFMDVATAVDTKENWDDMRLNGLPISITDRNLSKTIERTNPLSFLPDLNSTNWRIGDQTEVIFGTDFQKEVVYFYYWRDDNGVNHALNIMMVTDIVNKTVDNFDLTPVLETTPCPLAPIDLEKAGIVNMQAYAINGRITVGNQPAEIDVVLVDNTSKRVIGRSKSDPITGNYSFRCWTPGKKSIFAIHPETKALRMAAQRTPIAVG